MERGVRIAFRAAREIQRRCTNLVQRLIHFGTSRCTILVQASRPLDASNRRSRHELQLVNLAGHYSYGRAAILGGLSGMALALGVTQQGTHKRPLMNPLTQVNSMLNSASRHTSRLRGRSATRTSTVCIVDPQSDDYDGWKSPAQTKPLQFQVVPTAEEALRFSRTQAVDLWVVNLELPGLSGLELCSMLKARDSRTPVYLVAEEYSPDAERAAWAARATMFGCRATLAQHIGVCAGGKT